MHIVTELLLEEADRSLPDGRWLVFGGEVALPNELVAHGKVHWIPVDVRERGQAHPDVVVRDDISTGAYDRAVVPVPPGRDLGRRWFLVARQVLEAGGELIIAGANAEGAKSAISNAVKVFGPPVGQHYARKHRIARFAMSSGMLELPAWAMEDGIAPNTWQSFEVAIEGEVIRLETQPGVFAGSRLDAGTRLLLDHMEVRDGERVLDVGCGAGVIGVAAHLRGAGSVDLVDANLLAVEASARNITRFGIPGRAIASDVFSAVPGERYDLIVSNPPFHRGKRVDYSVADRLITEAPAHLTDGGRLLIVANAFLAYGKRMERVFRVVETIAATRQYHVLRASEPR